MSTSKSNRDLFIWRAIALLSISLIVVRTVRLGWFAGMDFVLWIIATVGLYFGLAHLRK